MIVTGGAGFIGSALVRLLASEGAHEVVVIDKLTYAATRSSLASAEASGRMRLIVEDICNKPALDAIFRREQPECIYHLAAETHVDRSISGPDVFVSTNIVGTFNVLEAARAYWAALEGAARNRFKLLHVSTDEVFGSLDGQGQFTETTAYDPSSPYSASKAASDHLAKAWWRTYGLPVVVSNCSNNYGPYQFPEKLIPLMILNGLEGRELPVYGKGENVRDWLHVDDHARALVQIAEVGRVGETYVVGGRNERTNLEVVQTICDGLDRLRPGDAPRRNLIRFVPDRPGHDYRYAIDASKLETELGWAPATSFEAAIEATIRWYLDNRDWWGPLRSSGGSGARRGETAPETT